MEDNKEITTEITTEMNGTEMNGTKKKKRWPFVAAGILLAAAAGVNAAGASHYQNCFLPHTTVNGIDASGKTWEEVQKTLTSKLDVYQLTITGRNDIKDIITSKEAGMKINFGDSVRKAQEEQNEWAWIPSLFQQQEISLESVISCDDTMLAKRIKTLNCMDKEQAKAPEDAYISEYHQGEGFSIIPEVENNQLKKKAFTKLVKEKLIDMETDIPLELLESEDLYKHPSVYRDDEILVKEVEQLNQLTKGTFTYTFDDEKEVITGEQIAKWLVMDDDYNISLDKDKVREFVNTISRRYDTFNTEGTRDFKTTYGAVVSVKGGDYGWWMNRPATTDALMEAILSGEDQELKPVYYQEAASYSAHDYGDTYVEINLTAQHLFLYENGKMIMESDFVSGRPSIKNTPTGVYGVTYKERAHTMVGDATDSYRVETSFWLPFAGNVGMHDATWRNQFGAELYKTGGSHGCVNLPYFAAKKIYETVSKDTPVICYTMPGTESTQITKHPDAEIAAIGVDAIERMEGGLNISEAEYEKRVRWARQVYQDLSPAQRKLVTNYQELLDAEKGIRDGVTPTRSH